MNHCVPDFGMDDDFSIPTPSSSDAKQKAEDDHLQLLSRNGQVVEHSQMHRSVQESPMTITPAEPLPPLPPENTQLFMAEDEMATWLHYPLDDLYTDLLYPTSTAPSPSLPPPPPPPQTLALSSPARAIDSQPPPPSKPPVPPHRNFPHFSNFRGRAPAQSTGLTVVDSNKPGTTPVIAPSVVATSVGDDSSTLSRSPSLKGGGSSGDMTVSSTMTKSGSGSGSGTSGYGVGVEGGGKRKQEVAVDRKRKGRETDEATTTTTTTECYTVSEDVEHESGDEKKHSRGSAAKRSRAAEVHNLSERRRRDRINERMRTLQELVPRCNKSDKASMLDEVIEYIKSMQMQMQLLMMPMGRGMFPMMYPGMQQQYMPVPPMTLGMSRPMMSSFPNASALPQTGSLMYNTPAAIGPPQLAPRFPIPAYPMTPVAQPGLSGIQESNQAESIPNSIPMQTPVLPQLPNMADPYQQYLALQQMHMHMHILSQNQNQNQSISQPGTSRPSSSKPSTSRSEEEFDDS